LVRRGSPRSPPRKRPDEKTKVPAIHERGHPVGNYRLLQEAGDDEQASAEDSKRDGAAYGEVEVSGNPRGVMHHVIHTVGSVDNYRDAAKEKNEEAAEKVGEQPVFRIEIGSLFHQPKSSLPPRWRAAYSNDAAAVPSHLKHFRLSSDLRGSGLCWLDGICAQAEARRMNDARVGPWMFLSTPADNPTQTTAPFCGLSPFRDATGGR
jgi:hypothetical protein